MRQAGGGDGNIDSRPSTEGWLVAIGEETMIELGRHLVGASAQAGDAKGARRPPCDEDALVADPPGACDDPLAPGREQLRLLVTTVEAQIIPRLVLAHRGAGGGHAPLAEAPARRTRQEEVDTCMRLLLDPAEGPLLRFAAELVARGLSPDSIYLEVFAPAARGLGEKWERDECSFTDVTVALGRLQQSLRRFAAHFRPESATGEPWRQALFAAVPGEQHTFGLSMIVQYFLRAGWDASMIPSPAADELLKLVRQEPIALIGLSMGRESHAPVLKALIGRLRSGSCNPALRLIVGGVAFVGQPGLAAELGADGTAGDALDAVNLAQQLVL
jgi:methanogenic corrinoid protein MtbC1